MPVDAVIYSRGSVHAGLTALIGTRLYPEKELSGTPTLPYVTFTFVSTIDPYHTFSLPIDFDADDQYRFQIWAKTHDSARSIATQIKIAFHGYESGTTSFMFQSEAEIPEEEEFVFHRVLDFKVHNVNS